MITWVIGSGGLLGSALARACGARFTPAPIPWSDPAQARQALQELARKFDAHAGEGPWRVIWAAGAATTATSHGDAMAELETLEGLLTGLRSARPRGPGAFFLTSSAGGVYGGSPQPPFTTSSPTAPLSPYGELKLAQEQLVVEMLTGHVPVTIGRISNLYGPGQDLDKLQGLVSRLVLAAITQVPVNIFVPLETSRDYLFVDDAARAVLDLTQPLDTDPNARIEIIASGTGTTIAQLIRTVGSVARRRVPVALGSHPSSRAQRVDLRMTPSAPLVHPTPLPVGVKAVLQDLLALVRDARLPAASGT